jgi:hypothetical protein
MSLQGDPEARATGQIDSILVNAVKIAAFSVIGDQRNLRTPARHGSQRRRGSDWVEPNGNCPTGDSYELRIAELLGVAHRTSSGTAGAVRS